MESAGEHKKNREREIKYFWKEYFLKAIWNTNTKNLFYVYLFFYPPGGFRAHERGFFTKMRSDKERYIS